MSCPWQFAVSVRQACWGTMVDVRRGLFILAASQPGRHAAVSWQLNWSYVTLEQRYQKGSVGVSVGQTNGGNRRGGLGGRGGEERLSKTVPMGGGGGGRDDRGRGGLGGAEF
jgi:hypothetical protein